MTVRFKFECFKIYNEKKGLEEMQCFKIKQEFTWQFYLRIIKTWFIPCNKCQEMIEKQWDVGVFLDGTYYDKFISWVSVRLCKKCIDGIYELNRRAEVILGNREYEPPVELSRKWLDDEDSRIRISEEDYRKRNEQAKSINYEEEKQKYQ